ncbi:hypothetical protein DUNSADRAFT_6262 [Dunaliella salina]|uniref:Uncharacterized protein n=1 Tax=Dunaliella salina TaxID=3046 RepID=A0ABQ7GNM2_DUNSA|nr:hypothetical protein DUNSADRAFT_6262 [Dunaliella salina]|eukprot:KAF5836196.1 hypothetical protein DUNSADRAFT_6262 [Dunaliella salina]
MTEKQQLTGRPPTMQQQPALDFHGQAVPLDWLIRKHDPNTLPQGALCTPKQQRKARKDQLWANSREQWFAAAAAGVHVAMFAYNLSFWGSEGMPPDRYWPDNTRLKMGVRPGRFGNLDGAKRVWYDNLSKLEGVKK